MKKILVPFDGSGYSEKAYEQALEIAEKFESELTVMTVIQSKMADSSGVSLTRMQEIQDEEEDAATAMFKTLEDRAKTKNISFSIKMVHNPSSSEAIVDYVDSRDMDLVVMGSHGRTGFRKIILGSVASGVVGHTKCSVLITNGEK